MGYRTPKGVCVHVCVIALSIAHKEEFRALCNFSSGDGWIPRNCAQRTWGAISHHILPKAGR